MHFVFVWLHWQHAEVLGQNCAAAIIRAIAVIMLGPYTAEPPENSVYVLVKCRLGQVKESLERRGLEKQIWSPVS